MGTRGGDGDRFGVFELLVDMLMCIQVENTRGQGLAMKCFYLEIQMLVYTFYEGITGITYFVSSQYFTCLTSIQ